MEFRVLGPLEVRDDGDAVAVGGTRLRALLAVLALHAGRPVSAERLAVSLWGDDVEPGAVKAIQVYVSRLRKALGDAAVVETTAGGYRLLIEPEELDAERFARAVTAGREALAEGDAERAGAVLRGALALWRGAPLEEFAWAPSRRPRSSGSRSCASAPWSHSSTSSRRPGGTPTWWPTCSA